VQIECLRQACEPDEVEQDEVGVASEGLPMPKQPEPDRLLLQLIRLSRAQFDMRCAKALTGDLAPLHDHISPRAYGLFAGIAVSYARPFKAGRGSPYGPLEQRWATFAGRPDFAVTHARLLDARDTLLAHNDLSPHRATVVWPEYMDGRPAITEARSAIDAAGVGIVRELCDFQEERFGNRVQELATILQTTLGWTSGQEINLDGELGRLRTLRAEP
jgi:hypothetical protein